MAKNESWIRVKIRNVTTGEVIYLYHPPNEGAAGQDIDRKLRSILNLPSPQPSGYKPPFVIEALPSGAEWLTALIPANSVPENA